jgi:hypothetical protein
MKLLTNLKLKIHWVITLNRIKFITKGDPTSECCMNKILCYGKNIKTYKWLYENFPNDFLPQQYDHEYYGQSNYNQELEFDRYRMSYDSNLEIDEYPQEYGHDYYSQSNYNQELEIDRHEMFYDSNFELDDKKSITQELGFNGYENFMERHLQELHTVLAPLEKSFAT